MLHLSVSLVPNLGKTLQLPQSDLTPWTPTLGINLCLESGIVRWNLNIFSRRKPVQDQTWQKCFWLSLGTFKVHSRPIAQPIKNAWNWSILKLLSRKMWLYHELKKLLRYTFISYSFENQAFLARNRLTHNTQWICIDWCRVYTLEQKPLNMNTCCLLCRTRCSNDWLFIETNSGLDGSC